MLRRKAQPWRDDHICSIIESFLAPIHASSFSEARSKLGGDPIGLPVPDFTLSLRNVGDEFDWDVLKHVKVLELQGEDLLAAFLRDCEHVEVLTLPRLQRVSCWSSPMQSRCGAFVKKWKRVRTAMFCKIDTEGFFSAIFENGCKSIESLTVRLSTFSEATVTELVQNLQSSTTMRELQITACQLTPESALCLSDALRFKTPLKELNLASNMIGDETGAILATCLAKNNRLEKVNLARNHLGAEFCAAMEFALANNSTLLSIILNNNPLTDRGGLNIAAGLHKNFTLEQLDLVATGLTDASIVQIIECIRERQGSLIVNVRGCSEVYSRHYNLLTEPAREFIFQGYRGVYRAQTARVAL